MWWVTLYDRNDRKIATYHVWGWAKLQPMMLSWALKHPNIEYVKITANKPA